MDIIKKKFLFYCKLFEWAHSFYSYMSVLRINMNQLLFEELLFAIKCLNINKVIVITNDSLSKNSIGVRAAYRSKF